MNILYDTIIMNRDISHNINKRILSLEMKQKKVSMDIRLLSTITEVDVWANRIVTLISDFKNIY